MAALKVFISSTCYDLGVVRSKLQEFLRSLGYDPILSEYSDVLFSPQTHTHTSCIDEVANCDVVILLIGSRFGGKAVPEALSRIDMSKVKTQSASTWSLDSGRTLSITQLEVLRALESKIPVFAFVEDKVMHDHLVYEKNKDKDILSQITFPSIEKTDSAQYIFEFINFLRLRNSGNALTTFSRIDDIEFHLRKQWSALMQRLLSEQRNRAARMEQAQGIQVQLEELKTAILSTIQAPGARDVARGVIRFRLLIDFVLGLEIMHAREVMLRDDLSWDSFLQSAGVQKAARVSSPRDIEASRGEAFLIRSDDTFFSIRISFSRLIDLPDEFSAFANLKPEVREAVLDSWTESTPTPMRFRLVRPMKGTFEQYKTTLRRPCRIEMFDISSLSEPTQTQEMEQIDDGQQEPSDDDIPF